MRPRQIPIILLILLALGFVIFRLISFVQLFFGHSGIAITQQEIAAAYAESGAQRRPQLIPKIIHQVFHDWHHQNQSIPSDWDDLRKTCINLHQDWEYIVCEPVSCHRRARLTFGSGVDGGKVATLSGEQISLVSQDI